MFPKEFAKSDIQSDLQKMFFSSFAKVAGIPQNFLRKFVTYQRQGCREFLLDSSDPAILTQIDQNGYFCFGFIQILI